MECKFCGFSEPTVVFKDVKKTGRRCDSCVRIYHQKYFLTKTKQRRKLSPDSYKISRAKHYQRNKDKIKRYVDDNWERYGSYWKKSRAKFYGNRKTLINALKSNPCMDCGKSFQPCQMDFDHRDPSKKLCDINSMVYRRSWKAIVEEIKKCDLVCANCHRERTCVENKYDERKSRKKEYVDSLKTGPCTDCNAQFLPRQMDFDHVGPKKAAVSTLINCSIQRILDEIRKCELVCANCHRLRTISRLTKQGS